MSYDDKDYSDKVQKLIRNFQSAVRIRIAKHDRYNGAIFDDEYGEEVEDEHIYDSLQADTINENIECLFMDGCEIERYELE